MIYNFFRSPRDLYPDEQQDYQDYFVQHLFSVFCHKTLTTVNGYHMILLRQMEDIRKHGVAFDYKEFDKDTSAIGAPIFNHEGKPVAAIVVAGPSQRISLTYDSPLVVELKDAAEKISAQLLFNGKIDE